MTLSAIAAMAENRVIGSAGDLPWHIPEDMKFFREKTKGRVMLMGRKTFESLGGPLPGRLHVVITRQKDYAPEGAHVFQDVTKALEFCEAQTDKWGEEIFIIGGGEIYRELLPKTDRIYLTEIHATFEGDTKFPEFSPSDFKETERRKIQGAITFDIVVYDRKQK